MATTEKQATDDYFLNAAEVEATYGVDLITAEVLRNALINVTRQMHGSLMRSAFSAIVRDAMDFGVCVHVVNDDGTTDLVGVTEGCTQFAFTHQHMTNMVLDEYGLENLGPGDTLVCNDAFRGGIHFGDLNFFRVIFDDEERPAFVITDAAHVFDIGGPVQGGFNTGAINMYEEGLRIPPTLLVSGDQMVRPTINLLLENTRSPSMMIGDVRALLGTLKTGGERMQALTDRYGFDTVRGAAHYALGLAERRMRAALSKVPDGDYEAERFLDDDGVGTEPVGIRASLKVRGSEAEIDFSGTDKQSIGAITTCWEEAARSIIGPKVILDPRHPMNAGAMRPFDVLLPTSSMVLGTPPTSQSNHIEMATKVAALMVDLFSKAVPGSAVAADSGTTGSVFVFGADDRPGREETPFGGVLLFGQGWGGTPVADGVSFCLSPLFNCRSAIIEYFEKDVPMVVWEWGTVIDSAGAGKFRGGPSSVGAIEALSDCYLTPFLDGARIAANGAHGGGDGVTSYGMLIDREEGQAYRNWNGVMPAADFSPLFGIYDDDGRPDPVAGEFSNGTLETSTKLTAWHLKPGQVFRMQVAAPGGYGNPLERDVERVLSDVANERVSVTQARGSYGVVIDPETLVVDVGATAALRAELDARRERGEWSTPPSYFRDWPRDEDTYRALAAASMATAGAGRGH
jgi:N-methylhydantoinase B